MFSTEVRRDLRLLFAGLTERHARVHASAAACSAYADDIRRTGSRGRAIAAIKRLVPCHDWTLQRSPPVLIGRDIWPTPIFADRDDVMLVVMAVRFGAVERRQGHFVTASIVPWALVVTRHATGRILERAPGCDAAALILQAHARTIAADRAMTTAHTRFIIPTDRGGFVAERHQGTIRGQDVGYLTLARTWLSADQQLFADQRARVLRPAINVKLAAAVAPLAIEVEADATNDRPA